MKYITLDMDKKGKLIIDHNIMEKWQIPEDEHKYSSYELDEMIETLSDNHKVPVVLVGDTYKADQEISLAKQLSIASVDMESFGVLGGYGYTFKFMVAAAVENKGLMRSAVFNMPDAENPDILVDHFRACYDHLLRLIGHSVNDTDTDYLEYYYREDVVSTIDIIDVLIVYRHLYTGMENMLLNKRACNK